MYITIEKRIEVSYNMPKSGSGAKSDGSMPDNSDGAVSISNERIADGRVVRIMTEYKIQASQLFPELKGQIYDFFNKMTQGNISGADGYYDRANKTIAVDSHVASGREERLREVVSHELAHALASVPRRGFRTTQDAFNQAHAIFVKGIRGSHKPSQADFASTISAYAASSRNEAFAEAFRDYTMNGKRATRAAKLIMQQWRG